jgi:hypothetical protein
MKIVSGASLRAHETKSHHAYHDQLVDSSAVAVCGLRALWEQVKIVYDDICNVFVLVVANVVENGPKD